MLVSGSTSVFISTMTVQLQNSMRYSGYAFVAKHRKTKRFLRICVTKRRQNQISVGKKMSIVSRNIEFFFHF